VSLENCKFLAQKATALLGGFVCYTGFGKGKETTLSLKRFTGTFLTSETRKPNIRESRERLSRRAHLLYIGASRRGGGSPWGGLRLRFPMNFFLEKKKREEGVKEPGSSGGN